MNETQGHIHISTGVTKLLWWLSTILFVMTEAIITIAIFRRHTFHSAQEFLDIYGLPLIAFIPWLVGMRGYSIAAKSVLGSSNSPLTSAVLSRQFLYTQIAGYMLASFLLSGKL